MAYKTIIGQKIYYEESGKGLPVLIPDAHHEVTAEKPCEINEIVSRFLENI